MPNIKSSRYRRNYGLSGQLISDITGCSIGVYGFVSCNIFENSFSLQAEYPASNNSSSFALVFSSSLPVTYQSNGVSWIFIAGVGGGSLALSTQIVSSSLTASNNNVLLVDASSGDVTIKLPDAASSLSTFYYIKKTDQTFNSVFIDASGSQTIDGSSNLVEIDYPQNIFQVVSNSTDSWFII